MLSIHNLAITYYQIKKLCQVILDTGPGGGENMKKRSKEIKIIGAGISGLTAGINLAKNGYDVKIYEKTLDCGLRFQGDLEGIENWSEKLDVLEELKMTNIRINFRLIPFPKIIFWIENKEIKNKYQKPLFYLLQRGNFKNSFDQGLKSQALALGIRIFFNQTIKESEADIVATGPFKGKLKGFAKGIKFKTDFKNIAVGLINKETSKRAYAYLLVENGRGCICFCLERKPDFSSKLEKTIDFFKEKYNIRLRDVKPVGGYTVAHLKRRYKIGKTLYVGEAAGLQDYLFGFGMRYAIQSGFLADDSIINNYDYERAARNKFEKRMKVGLVNRLIWGSFEKSNYKIPALIFRIFQNKTSFFYKTYNGAIFRRSFYPLVAFILRKKFKNL